MVWIRCCWSSKATEGDGSDERDCRESYSIGEVFLSHDASPSSGGVVVGCTLIRHVYKFVKMVIAEKEKPALGGLGVWRATLYLGPVGGG
jgi:hypothetical protein